MVARSDASTIETGSSAMMMRGLEQQGAGDHDALALAAAQLVRIAPERLFGAQADAVQRLFDQLPALRPDFASPNLAMGVVSR